MGVRTSGLPCRATPDCDTVFTLTHQDSMDALKEAADRRNAHEIAAHDYRHVVRELPGATPFSQSTPKRRGPRRRNAELDPV